MKNITKVFYILTDKTIIFIIIILSLIIINIFIPPGVSIEKKKYIKVCKEKLKGTAYIKDIENQCLLKYYEKKLDESVKRYEKNQKENN